MKNFFVRLYIIILLSVSLSAQPTPAGGAPAATQAEVNAGTVQNKYVSPYTLTNWSGAGATSITAASAAAAAGLFWISGGADRSATATDTIDTANATNLNATNFTFGGVTFTGVSGTGNIAASANAVFTSSLQIPNAAAPTTDAFGEIAGDNNAWAASRGAVQFFDGTANTYLVGPLASDTPSNGQVPTWNTGGTVTWETPSGGSLTATYVGYGSGGNVLTGTSEFFYDVGNTRLQVANVRIGGGNTTVTTASGDLNITSSTGDVVLATGTRLIQTGTALFFPRGGLKRVSTQFDKTNTTLADVTGLSVALAASTSYRFRAVLFTTSDVGGGVKAAVASSGTVTSIIYEGFTYSGGTITQTRSTSSGGTVGAITAVTAATIVIEGVITTNAAGNLTIQFAENAAVNTSSVLVGSYMEVFGF